MANTFNVNQMMSREVAMILGNTRGFASMGVTRKFGSEFPQKGLGQTFNIQKPARFTVTEGPDASIQDITPQYVPITFTGTDQKHIDIALTAYERSLSLVDLREQVLKPMAAKLSGFIDYKGHQHAARNTWNSVGTPGTTPSALKTYNLANAKLSQNGAPKNGRRVFITSAMDVELVDAGKALFHSSSTVSGQYLAGSTHRQNFMGYDDWFVTENCYTHTVGTYGGTPLVNGANQTGTGGDNGTQSLVTDGWTATTTTLNPGDIFTLGGASGPKNINPETGDTTNAAKQFVVRTASTTDGSGNSTLAIASTMTTTGTFKNVSAVAADNAAVTLEGTSGLVHSRGIALQQNAFGLVFGRLDIDPGAGAAVSYFTDSDTGVTVRSVTQYDINTDKTTTRIDVLFKYFNLYPECACIIQA